MRKGVDCKGVEWEEIKITKKMIDIRGQRFGRLIALFPVYIGKEKRTYWLCKCDCGSEIACRIDMLKDKTTQSCGCYAIERNKLRYDQKRENMIGKIFGRLTVISFDCMKMCNDGVLYAYYWCQCSCGSHPISVKGTLLNSGNTTSCGCIVKEKNASRINNLTNMRFGKLVARRLTDMRDIKGSVIWECDCDCGNQVHVSSRDLISGHKQSCGCIISVGESHIENILISNKIIYLHNKQYFDDLINTKGNPLRYDFILFNENQNVYRLIEFDGIQHERPVESFGGIERFQEQQENDIIKNQYALSHNIPLVRIPYKKRNNITLDDLLGDQFLIKGEK